MQQLSTATHHYAIWDDHDFGPNDSDWSYRMRDTHRSRFLRSTGRRTYGTAEAPGVYGSFE
jgi:alkaline phosphatase D